MLTTPNGDAYADTGPGWSPDGTKILFSRWSFSDPGELFVIPAAGGTPTSLHVRADRAAWGPSRIAYVANFSRPASLWTALPGGGDRQKMAEGSGDAALGDPAWSGDGRLACAVGRAGAIVIVSAGAKLRLQLPFVEIASLGWSPDGTRFVVVGLTKDSAAYDVYTVRTDGTGLRRLTHDVEAYWASWR